MKKILYGVSGIGNGHANRELPIINELAKNNKICILCHDDSFVTFKKNFSNHPQIKLIEVEIPFVLGSETGLDWVNISDHPANLDKNFLKKDCLAFAEIESSFGIPDLAITDYEPLTALFAYSHNIPLVTIDQQSKFLHSDLPEKIENFTYADEVHRLRMFFPKADSRIVCSFFKTNKRLDGEDVQFFPSPIKKAVTSIIRQPKRKNQILVYISSARDFVQSPEEVIEIFSSVPEADFHLFIKPGDVHLYITNFKNIFIYSHGSEQFINLLSTCDGIVSTAGHSLLSEAMYLGIPVYAIPVFPYEQHLNAKIIGDNGFGMSELTLSFSKLIEFISQLPKFTQNIANDQNILLRGEGKELIVDYLSKNFLSHKKILLFSPPFSGHLNILKEFIKDTKTQFKFHLVITGWSNILPDLTGLENQTVDVLSAGKLNETDPALWTFDRTDKLFSACLKITDEFKPDLIIYDFFSLEGYLIGKLKNIPYFSSIPAFIDGYNNKEYLHQKFLNPENQSAIKSIHKKTRVIFQETELEMVSDGIHMPGLINLVWSYQSIASPDFTNGRSTNPYVFVSNLRGDNWEKRSYRNHKPLIYLSFGTVVMNNLWNQQEETRRELKLFIKKLAEKWQDKNYQVIFVTQGKHIIDEYPDNWWVYDQVDQVEILSRADVFITHGGSNSFHESLLQRVPMIVVPFFGDQLLVADRVEELGLGCRAGGSDSIDTHNSKNFLNSDLVNTIDRQTTELLKSSSIAKKFLQIELPPSNIKELLLQDIKINEGDIIIGKGVEHPVTRDQLPNKLEIYLDWLNRASGISSEKVSRMLWVLHQVTSKDKTNDQKLYSLIRFFSYFFNIHCLIENDIHQEMLFNNRQNFGPNLKYYKQIHNLWCPQYLHDQVEQQPKAPLSGKIVLTSENIHKKQALIDALEIMSLSSEFISIDPHTDQQEQSVGMDQILHAAFKRIESVVTKFPEANIISIVSGIVYDGQQFKDQAAIVIRYSDGSYGYAVSNSLAFPTYYIESAKKRNFQNITVGTVIGEDESDKSIATNPHSFLTKNLISRSKLLTDAILKALQS